jgi:tetratricopeptide (TPR) repeat protein
MAANKKGHDGHENWRESSMRMRSQMKMNLVFALAVLFLRGGVAAGQVSSDGGKQNEFIDALRSAKAASDARRWKDASRDWERVVQINPVNEEYWQQLAEALYKNGDYARAIPAFQKVLDLGGYCFPSETAYNIARSFAFLGDKENAVTWLRDAFARGYRDLDHAKSDPAFGALHDDSRVAALLGLRDTGATSRGEGWQYDLSLLQQEVERKSYPQFAKLSKDELQAEVAKLTREIPNLSDPQATIEVMKLVAKVGVGHTEALPPHTLEFAETLPLKFFLFKEGLYVVAADPRYRDLLGTRVIGFGDTGVSQVLTALKPVIFKDNEMWPKVMGPNLLRYTALLKGLNLISDSSNVPLKILDSRGQTRMITVTADTSYPDIWNIYPFPSTWVGFSSAKTGPIPLYLRNMDKFYWFEYLPESRTVYFQYNRVLPDAKEPFDEFVTRLFAFVEQHDVDKLVIDLRWNNGGNTYLLPPLIHALVSAAKINREGKLFVIIGRRTFSAAENAAAYIQRDTNAIFVGEPTGGKPNSLGDEVYFTLPSSKLTASVADVYWESSWPQDFRTWIAPQLFVEPTFEAYAANQDAAMEAILGLSLSGVTISQHPGFGCKSEQNIDADDQK